MRTILLRSRFLGCKTSVMTKSFIFTSNTFLKDSKDEKEMLEIDKKYKARPGVIHDKTQSIQEESYFYKEELEQLKELKEKVKKREAEGNLSKGENEKK